jgi:hypothetical protein
LHFHLERHSALAEVMLAREILRLSDGNGTIGEISTLSGAALAATECGSARERRRPSALATEEIYES